MEPLETAWVPPPSNATVRHRDPGPKHDNETTYIIAVSP